jgi:hypothetical protein
MSCDRLRGRSAVSVRSSSWAFARVGTTRFSWAHKIGPSWARGFMNPRTFCVLDLDGGGVGCASSVLGRRRPADACANMADRGVDTFLVVSRNDPGVAYVDTHAAAGDARARRSMAGFERDRSRRV